VADEDGGRFFHPANDFSEAKPGQMRMMATVGTIVFGATTCR
jgi:hypothetical protein